VTLTNEGDPVYNGKALHAMLDLMKMPTPPFSGRDVLFLHTGGQFGLAAAEAELEGVLGGGVHRLAVE
jgi:1-aminocyclopropane-1-carboxylate deaminase/D-cysteine desulfhydrase-like pyridoxal-dependent ACC family enzyme